MNCLRQLACPVLCGVFLLLGGRVEACKVPVFRYALERWPADPYRMVALVDGAPTGGVAEAIAELQSLSPNQINVKAEVIDLAELSEAERWSVEGLEDDRQAPLLQVFYPDRDGRQKLCWSGPLSLSNVQAWMDSPLRQRIVTDIQGGVSAVWVLVEGEDRGANDKLAAELESALNAAMKEIAIPEGVIPRREAALALSQNPTASMDDVLRSDVPLRIDFSIQRLEVEDDRETAFRQMVRGWAPSASPPFVFPVFGRGRVIEPLALEAFTPSSVMSACRYMVGECSCSVKALNPGVDLILKTDWRAVLGSPETLIDLSNAIDAPLPPLMIPPGSEPTQRVNSVIQDPVPSRSIKRSWFGLAALLLCALPLAFMLTRRTS